MWIVYNNKQMKFHGPQSHSGYADQKHSSHLMFVDLCIIVQFLQWKKTQQDETVHQNFIIPYFK
jgi:hypothetical protein